MQTLSWDYIKEKWQHAGFQRYFRNTGWMFFARVFILIVSFFLNVYMARYLGPANFGLLNYVFSFVGLFAFISSLGIESVANREIATDHSQKNIIIGTSFYLKLLGSFLAVFIIFIFARITTSDPIILALISMYSLSFIFSAFNIIDVYFQSQVLSKYPAVVTIIASVISATLKITAMSLGAGIIWLTAIYVLESAISAFGLMLFFIYNGHSIKEWIFDKATAFIILKNSWPLMISSVAWSIYMTIDQVMIKNMLGNKPAGIYSVASNLSEFWYFIPGIICGSLFPAVVNAKKVSEQFYEKRLKKLYSALFWMSLFIAIITTLLAYFIIHLLFGIQYLDAVTTLRIYVWAGIGVSLGYAANNYLLIENLTRINAVATVIGAITNVALNLILIPKYGINGAAFASFVSYTIVTLSIFFFKKTRSQLKIILESIILPFKSNDRNY